MSSSMVESVLDLLVNELECPVFALAKIKPDNLANISLIDFSVIINWISIQLQFFARTDSIVHKINDENDIDAFLIELNSFLHELGSIYADSFDKTDSTMRLSILHSVSGDLLAARIRFLHKFNADINVSSEKLNFSNDIKIINKCLGISSNLKDLKLYFQSVKEKLNQNLLKLQEEDSLLLPNKQKLSREQWKELKKINEKLMNEYAIRREMLLRRADLTINSFSWKEDKSRSVDEETIKNIYRENRKSWSVQPNITLSHSLASRSSDYDPLINKRITINHADCLIEPPKIGTANTGLQQRLQLHKFLIGAVPDRGGRPFEQAPLAKETFAQQQAQRDSRGRGHRGGGGDGRGGQRQQYQQQHYQNQSQNYNQNKNFCDDRIQNVGWQRNDQGHQQQNWNDRNKNYDNRGDYNNSYERSSNRGHNRGYNNQQSYHHRGNRGRGYGRNQDYYY
ncbi:hypothetical protein NH340_JMT05839 [Sarcoptes scabiei]|nr:hypothetical protein NH340_JMT05839 [Sarcoptes scabiei]